MVVVVLTAVFTWFVVLGPLGVTVQPSPWLVLAVPGAVLVDRLLLAAEARGWIYWRRRQASSTALGSAALTVQAILEPEKAHVVEERRDQGEEEPGDDDPVS